MITLSEIKMFWAEPDEGTIEETEEIIRRINSDGFADDVPCDIAEDMDAWANVEPGQKARYFAEKVITALTHITGN